jgi:hypothetical protein
MDLHNPYNSPTQNVLCFRKKDFTMWEREFLVKKVYSHSLNFLITHKMIDDLKILYGAEIHFVDEYLRKMLRFIELKLKKTV